MKEKPKTTYLYSETNKDMNTHEELRNLLKKWEDSPESELRTRLIEELNEELKSQ